MNQKIAKVFLVGAGPGDPELLTIKGKKILQSVDVIAYDSLISPEFLMKLNTQAELIHVGRRGYETKIRPDLHPIVIEKAKQGKTVARLKSGDPMVFGKAFEECQELIKAKVPFEVIPGITSPLGAASSLILPLTQKGFSSNLIFMNGHHVSKKPEEDLFSNSTLVFYMAKKKLENHCKNLILSGKNYQTPALYIEEATTPHQKVLKGNLSTLPDIVKKKASDSPALLIIGESLQNYPFLKENSQPSHQEKPVRILALPSKKNNLDYIVPLKTAGLDVYEAPPLRINYLSTHSPLLKSLKDKPISNYNLFFKTAECVIGFKKLICEAGIDIRSFFTDRWLPLSMSAKDELKNLGIFQTDIPDHNWPSVSFTDESERDSSAKMIHIPCYQKAELFPNFPPPNFDLIIIPDVDAMVHFNKSCWSHIGQDTNVLTFEAKTYSFLKKGGLSRVYMAEKRNVAEMTAIINSSSLQKAQ